MGLNSETLGSFPILSPELRPLPVPGEAGLLLSGTYAELGGGAGRWLVAFPESGVGAGWFCDFSALEKVQRSSIGATAWGGRGTGRQDVDLTCHKQTKTSVPEGPQ